MLRSAMLLCSSVSLILLSCAGETTGPGPSSADVTADGGAEVASGEDAGFPDGDASGDVAPPVFGARVRVLESAADGIGGRAAAGVAGDLLLVNEHVRFVVRRQEQGLIAPYGGNLVDADVVRAPGEAGNDRFSELFPMIGFGRTLRPETIEIVDDGTRSGTAVVRVRGVDAGIPLVDSALPTQAQNLRVTVDYVLASGAHHLEIVLRVASEATAARTVALGTFVQFGDAVRSFHHRCGADDACLMGHGDVDWLAAAGGGVSYGLAAPAGQLFRVLLAREAVLLVQGAELRVPAAGEAEARMYFLVGGGTIAELAEQAWTLREAPPRGTVELELIPPDERTSPEEAWGEAWIEAWARADGSPVSAVSAGPGGRASLFLPPGDYELRVSVPGAEAVTDGPFAVGTEQPVTRRIDLPSRGWLHATVHDGEGAPLDALVLLQQGRDAPDSQGANRTLIVVGGEGSFPVLPGDYTAVGAHGYAYDVDRQNVTVRPGETAEVNLALPEVIPTPGELFVDTHDHSEYSIDSDVLVEDRVRNALAVGLDVLSTTDHDTFRSLQPVVEALGVADRLLALPGSEISPLWGHTVGLGCTAPHDYTTYYDVPFLLYDDEGRVLRSTTPTELWRSARERFGCDLLIIAHPWCSQATFDYLGLRPGEAPAGLLPQADLTLVDALELLNSHDDFTRFFLDNLPGWLSLLDYGLHLPAVGGSDEHGLGATLGHPRNLVAVADDTVATLTPGEVYGALRDMRSQVVGGPVIRLTVEGQGPGQTVVGAPGPVHVSLRVLAAPWVPVDYARVYANGMLVMAPQPAEAGVVRVAYEGDLPLTRDTHIVAVAGAETARMGVASAGRESLSATNPIFVDVEGDGYRAPRVPSPELPPPVSGPPPSLFDCRAATGPPPERRSPVPLSCVVDPLCHKSLVVAHRGAGGAFGTIAPENSLAAIRAGLLMGVDGVEVDVRDTADGQLVLMHDDTVDRTTTGSGHVSEMTLDALRALHFDTGAFARGDFSCEGPPSFEALLELTRDRVFIDLDCKTDRVDLVVAAIVAAGLQDQVFVSTGSFERAEAARAIDPSVRVQVRPDTMAQILEATERFEPDPDIYEVPPDLLADAAAHVHPLGRKVFADVFFADASYLFTQDPALYQDLYSAGADVLQTEYAPNVLRVLGRWTWW